MKNKLIRLRTYVLIMLTHRIALPLLRLVRKPNAFTWTLPELEQMPEGSLGNDLSLFLQKRNLPLLRHYARHDLKHVLLGYDTTDQGEVCLQSFMLGNGRISFPVLATVLYGFVTMPEYWPQMKQAWRKGRKSRSFHGWNWQLMASEQTRSLQEKIFNQHHIPS